MSSLPTNPDFTVLPLFDTKPTTHTHRRTLVRSSKPALPLLKNHRGTYSLWNAKWRKKFNLSIKCLMRNPSTVLNHFAGLFQYSFRVFTRALETLILGRSILVYVARNWYLKKVIMLICGFFEGLAVRFEHRLSG